MKRWSSLIFLYLVIIPSVLGQEVEPAIAQVVVSATPARGIITTSTPEATSLALPTPLLTATATDVGIIFLEAKPESGTINVRLEPDPESPRIGGINPGQTYEITGRYFRWIRFRYTESQLGWVFDELVNIIGPAEFIPEIDPFSTVIEDTDSVNATQTYEAITLTPGGILTATANSRFIEAPTTVSIQGNEATANGLNTRLPTFTPPPSVLPPPNGFIPTEQEVVSNSNSNSLPDSVPPVVPIVALAVLGLIGIIISAPRR